eukprot:SAG25_NODE_310_length_10020_cov_8.397440_4_plen_79_part_00
MCCDGSQLRDGEELWLLFRKDGTDMRLLPESAGADRAPPSPHPALDDTGAADDEHARHRQQRRLSKLVDDVSSVTQMT